MIVSPAIQTFLQHCGVDFARSPLATMERFYADLLEANTQFNLTRITDEIDFWRLHIADSLAVGLVAADLLSEPIKVADVGCGPGLPLLPLAWANRQGHFTGIEATGKKCGFIDEEIGRLDLGHAEIVNSQLREAARMDPLAGAFDVVVMRAVGPTGKYVRDAARLLKADAGGRIIAYKTPDATAEECDLTNREAAKQKFDVTESKIIHLPEGSEPRQFVILTRRPPRPADTTG